MKVHSLHLRNAAHFSNLHLEFSPHEHNITVIFGEQGAGKTTVLKNLYHALSWFSARYKDARTAGVVMADQDIYDQRQQSKIEIQVQIPLELGQLSEGYQSQPSSSQICSWTLSKVLKSNSTGLSRVELQQLEELVSLYQNTAQQDHLQNLPVIAYYPADRFVHDINLINKNNPLIFQNHHAYDLTPLPYTTFTRFFEWLREVHDIENAKTAQYLQQWLNTQPQHLTPDQFQTALAQFKHQHHSPHLQALKQALHTIFPEVSDLFVQYHPKLQLMVTYQGQNVLYQQLSNSLKTWIALIGDLVRRLCLLNPHHLYPCLEGDGILIIDAIDHQLDASHSTEVLHRLKQAFPRLQIIVSTHQHEVLEQNLAYQCFRLHQRKAYPIPVQNIQHQFDEIYDGLNRPYIPIDPPLHEPSAETELMVFENLLSQIQHHLNLEQQQELIRRLNNDAAHPSSLES